jgi:hypothetical protein
MRWLSICVLILTVLLLWHCSDKEPTGPNDTPPVNRAPEFASVSSQNVMVAGFRRYFRGYSHDCDWHLRVLRCAATGDWQLLGV